MSAIEVPDVWEMVADIIDPKFGNQHWKPQPKQAMAEDLAKWVDELLYGGAAGGGKSEWLMEHLIGQMERYANNRGVIFRRVFPSLNRSIIPRLKKKLHRRAKWNGNEHTFTFPNGSVLECASLQYSDSVLDYQGAEYGVVAFEEITEFLLEQYDYMRQRLRPPDLTSGIRPHVVATTNPGGPGHRWVKRRWVKPKLSDIADAILPEPGEVWRPISTLEQPNPGTRCFVPATLADNPLLMLADPEYVDRIRSMTDRGMRLALEKGDWDAIDAVEGALVSQQWLDSSRVSPVQVPPSLRRAIAVDPSDGDEAKTSDEYGVWAGSLGVDGVGYTEYSGGWKLSVRKMAENTIQLMHDMHADVIFVEKNHGGAWLREVFRQVDPYANIEMVWASHGKKTRAEPVAALFEPDPHAKLKYRARLVGHHEELEGEWTTFTGAKGDASPNRLDACVWGLWGLIVGRHMARKSEMEDQRLNDRR